MSRHDNTVVIEDARILFRNFAGKEGKFNREGDRNFAVILTDEVAKQMLDDGWNVKFLKAREEDEADQPYIQVSVNFRGRPPRIVMITSRGRTPLTEREVEILDWADIRKVDLILNPYEWEIGDKSGIKAYLQSLFITIIEDPLELKYADLEDATPRGRDDN
jgi:hypothetical protein